MTIFHKGLRHNKHMLRMIKNGTERHGTYSLGHAYGNTTQPIDDTEKRRRILDHWGLQHQSLRRPESDSTAEPLPIRAQTAHFHQLHQHQQDLLSKRQHQAPLSRRDIIPGTKERLHLGRNHVVLNVQSYPILRLT